LAIHFHQFFTNSICIGSSKFQQATSLKDLDLKPIETLNGQPSIDKVLAVLEKIKRDRDFHKYVKLDLVKESSMK
jgi:hypothetical protein